jgi:hypothetical protein
VDVCWNEVKTGAWYDKAGLTNGATYVLAQDTTNPVASDNEIVLNMENALINKLSLLRLDSTVNGKFQNDQAREKELNFHVRWKLDQISK